MCNLEELIFSDLFFYYCTVSVLLVWQGGGKFFLVLYSKKSQYPGNILQTLHTFKYVIHNPHLNTCKCTLHIKKISHYTQIQSIQIRHLQVRRIFYKIQSTQYQLYPTHFQHNTSRCSAPAGLLFCLA